MRPVENFAVRIFLTGELNQPGTGPVLPPTIEDGLVILHLSDDQYAAFPGHQFRKVAPFPSGQAILADAEFLLEGDELFRSLQQFRRLVEIIRCKQLFEVRLLFGVEIETAFVKDKRIGSGMC